MFLDDSTKYGLGVALNEATLLGIQLDASTRRVAVTFSVLTLPETGPPPEDPRVQFVFAPVGRVAASLREGRWDDDTAAVVAISAEELLDVSQKAGGHPVYGWEFFDLHKDQLFRWGDRLSLDWRGGEDGTAHSVLLFQEGVEQHLDVLIWFDEFTIHRVDGTQVPIDEFCRGGERWWKALHDGDPRTDGHGIVPSTD